MQPKDVGQLQHQRGNQRSLTLSVDFDEEMDDFGQKEKEREFAPKGFPARVQG